MSTEKKKRRNVTPARMYRSLDAILAEHGLTRDDTIGALIAALEKAIVEEATR